MPGSVLDAANPAANKADVIPGFTGVGGPGGEMGIKQTHNYKLWCVLRRLTMKELSERKR